MKRKIIAITLAAIMALQLAACGNKDNNDEIIPIPSVETVDIPETKDTPDTVATPDTTSDPVGPKSTDTDTDSEKQSDSSSSASNAEKKNSSSSAASKNTSSKISSSAAASKDASSKATSSKATSSKPTTTTTTITGSGNGNTTTVNSQNTTTTVPDPEPTPQPEPTTEPTPTPAPQPEPTPQPTPEPEPQPEPEPEPEPPVIDSPFARPFDVEYIRNYMIDYGVECGLILDESLNIDNAAWFSPYNTRWSNEDGDNWNEIAGMHDTDLFQQHCREEIDCLITLAEYDGVSPSDVRFNVQIVEIPEYPGEYRIYVPYG